MTLRFISNGLKFFNLDDYPDLTMEFGCFKVWSGFNESLVISFTSKELCVAAETSGLSCEGHCVEEHGILTEKGNSIIFQHILNVIVVKQLTKLL